MGSCRGLLSRLDGCRVSQLSSGSCERRPLRPRPPVCRFATAAASVSTPTVSSLAHRHRAFQEVTCAETYTEVYAKRNWIIVRESSANISLTLSSRPALFQWQDKSGRLGAGLGAGVAGELTEFGNRPPTGLHTGFSFRVYSLSLSLISVHKAVVLFDP